MESRGAHTVIKLLGGVALGGALGSLCRFGLTRALSSHNPHHAFSLGVLVANLVGCFLIGVIFTRLASLDPPREALTAVLITGFLGGLTTYSTYALELFRMGHEGALRWVVLYLLVHIVGGLGAVWAGVVVAGRA
jgi:CrcB protein